VARQVNGVTVHGQVCTGVAACLPLAEQIDIDYDGLSGLLQFSRPGEPGLASFAVEQFGGNNRINDLLTEYRLTQVR
jgi:hypothetical protein